MLRTRLMTGLSVLPIALAAVYLGGAWFFGGVLLIAVIAGWEFWHMMTKGGYQPSLGVMLLLIFALISDCFIRPTAHSIPFFVVLAMLMTLVWQLFRPPTAHATADWALTLVGGLFIGWGMGHLVALRLLDNGIVWVCLTLFTTWGTDTLAYFIGRSFGKRPLWPRHSPKKTVEGFFGGFIGSLMGAGFLGLFASHLVGWSILLTTALFVPIVALFGDLAVSMMKRDVGVKDTSNLFPGHGGFLDRLDSLLFVNVVVYYYVRSMTG